jgi:hypothetical protein
VDGEEGEEGPKRRGKRGGDFINLLLKVGEAAFAQTAAKTTKKGPPKDPYVMTDAAIAKGFTDPNLLPHDSGVGVGQLSRLFLRPNAAVQQGKRQEEGEAPGKNVRTGERKGETRTTPPPPPHPPP